MPQPATAAPPDPCGAAAPDTPERAASQRTCANPRCGRPLPPNASGTRRHCSSACRQACHRDRRPGRSAADPAYLAAKAEDVRNLAAQLADAAAAVGVGHPADYTKHTAALVRLADALTHAAVAYDRAQGASWPMIAAHLHVEPETARRRHRRP